MATLLLGKVLSLHSEVAWFEGFTESIENVACNGHSFSSVDAVRVDIEFLSTFWAHNSYCTILYHTRCQKSGSVIPLLVLNGTTGPKIGEDSRRAVSPGVSTIHTSRSDSMLIEINGSFSTLHCDNLVYKLHMISTSSRNVTINFRRASRAGSRR